MAVTSNPLVDYWCRDDIKLPEFFDQEPRIVRALLKLTWKSGELRQQYGGLPSSQSMIRSESDVFVPPSTASPSLIANRPCFFGESLVTSHQHTPLTGRPIL